MVREQTNNGVIVDLSSQPCIEYNEKHLSNISFAEPIAYPTRGRYRQCIIVLCPCSMNGAGMIIAISGCRFMRAGDDSQSPPSLNKHYKPSTTLNIRSIIYLTHHTNSITLNETTTELISVRLTAIGMMLRNIDSQQYFLITFIKAMQKKEGNIKVFCRFRPFNSKEITSNAAKIHRINNHKQLILKEQRPDQISFMYDWVFDMDSCQEDVFEKVGNPVLNNILDGFHGTIMAYGQTSSGKTHTMQGYDLTEKQNRGIMPRMIEKLFTAIQKSPQSVEFKLKISIFELYLQKIRDLLDVSKNDLRIRESKQQGCYVENLTEHYVNDKHQLFRIITYGQKNRITCATNMNEHSSRSHLIFLLTINQFNNLESSSKTSKLFLIDLAGSQKISKTGAEGKVLEEAKKINLSLTNLGKVIKALSQKGEKAHIPYRDSKLTRILKDSLGGNSKTTLIVTCSPHQMHLPETITTLRFGQNAQKVKNKPKINRELTVQELQKIIEKIQVEKQENESKIKLLEEYITINLKAELPTLKNVQSLSELKADNQQQKDLGETMTNVPLSQETEQRIRSLEEELQSSQFKLKTEMDKYYQLKKEYNELHDNLTSILKENIDLQDQLEQKKKKSIFSDKSMQDNAYLIKLIVGQIMHAIGKETEQMVIKQICKSHWYKRIMIDNLPCSDYWQVEKEEMDRQLQELLNESRSLQDTSKQREESRVHKDNEKILMLEEKFDLLFQEYNRMMSLQTSWKAQCQLYERKLKHKEEQIQTMENQVMQLQQQMDEMYLFDDLADETMSVKSNKKIVNPLKGGGYLKFH